jgi:hypothetical protein
MTLLYLMFAADLFVEETLKNMCKRKLLPLINPENALPILQFCVQYGLDGDVKGACWKLLKNTTKDELIDALIFSARDDSVALNKSQEIRKQENMQIEKLTLQMKLQHQEHLQQVKALQQQMQQLQLNYLDILDKTKQELQAQKKKSSELESRIQQLEHIISEKLEDKQNGKTNVHAN